MTRLPALVAILGLMVGCATAVEDPQPAPTPDPPSVPPPAETLSGDLGAPTVSQQLPRDLPPSIARQKPPLPFGEANEEQR